MGAFDDLLGDLPAAPGGSSADPFADLTSDIQGPRPTVLRQAAGDLARGVNALQSNMFGVVAAGADALGATETRDRYMGLRQRNQDWAQANPSVIPTYKDIRTDSVSGFLEDAGRYALGAVVEQVPNLAVTLPLGAAGGLGALAAGGGRAATALGIGAGGAAPSIALESGEAFGKVFDETGQYRPDVAFGAGAISGALDALPQVRLLSRLIGPGPANAVAHGIARRIGTEAAKQFLAEGSTEVAQDIVKNLGVQLVDPAKSPWDPANVDGYIESFLRGGIAGGVMGGVGGIARPRPPERQPMAGQAGQPGQVPPASPVPAEVPSPFAPPIPGTDPFKVPGEDTGPAVPVLPPLSPQGGPPSAGAPLGAPSPPPALPPFPAARFDPFPTPVGEEVAAADIYRVPGEPGGPAVPVVAPTPFVPTDGSPNVSRETTESPSALPTAAPPPGGPVGAGPPALPGGSTPPVAVAGGPPEARPAGSYPQDGAQARPSIIDLTGMGSAISENLRASLWAKVEQGDGKEAGRPSPMLRAAIRLRKAGAIVTREDFDAFANEFQVAGTPDERAAVANRWREKGDSQKSPWSGGPANPFQGFRGKVYDELVDRGTAQISGGDVMVINAGRSRGFGYRVVRQGQGEDVFPPPGEFWYEHEAARRAVEAATPDLDPPGKVAQLPAEIPPPPPSPLQGEGGLSGTRPSSVDNRAAVAAVLRDALREKGFKTIVEARRFIQGLTGRAVKPGTPEAKAADEQLEAAVVMAARQIVAEGGSPQQVFDELLRLYENQPSLSVRTSTSMINQAYSTPVPLAWVASRLAGIGPDTTVYEPTAGNGALLIGANPTITWANEIDPQRRAALQMQGFQVSGIDATSAQAAPKGTEIDVVIENPPFGITKDPKGNTVRFQVTDRYDTGEIDHAIALRSLEAMKPDGSAVLILGGLNKLARTREARSNGYNAKAKRDFYYTLYNNYRVVDHFTVPGELYEKQGAGWPVDVIVIQGRGKSSRALPAADPPPILESWGAIKAKLDAQPQAHRSTVRPPAEPAGSGAAVEPPAADEARGADVPGSQPAGGGQQPPAGQRAGVLPRPDRGQPADVGLPEPAAGVRPGSGDERPGPAGPDRVADDFDAAFDAALDETFGPVEPPAAPAAPARDTRTTGEVAASAVRNVAESADKAMSALVQLFGGPGAGRVGSGPSFDEQTYARAKPLFVQAAQKFQDALGDVRELVRRMVAEMQRAFGMSREVLEKMRPYLRRFVEDVTGGKLKLDEPSVPNENRTLEPAAPRPPAAVQETETDKQVAYTPASATEGMGTLVPVNMQRAIGTSLDRLRQRVGEIDAYVADRLQYPKDRLADYFGAEQVDAIALALDNFDAGKGFIIGDQTGIGKGRVVAAMIRYAKIKGLVPIFVTEKPNLFGDMWRDLRDTDIKSVLGGREPNILVTNASADIPMDEDGTVRIKTPPSAKHNETLAKAARSKDLGGFDMVFTTYNQMQTLKGNATPRMHAIEALAPRALLIFDEAHNAGGTEGGREDPKAPITRSKFARNLVNAARTVFYSSATYAKRPQTMDLYSKTDMALAVQDISKLGETISKGGVPLQQVVASMLAEAGQYIRRERSFDGVTYDAPVVPVDRAMYGRFSQQIKQIQLFSERFMQEAAGAINEGIKAEGQAVSGDGSTGGAGASSTNFTAIMHNIINQMLLSLTADVAASKAIDRLKAGEKPVITVANTMGSFIQEYAEDGKLQNGDKVGLTFNSLLDRYLERSRMVLIKKPYAKKGEIIRHRVTDEELGKEGVAFFKATKEAIAKADFGAMPVSPIDWMRKRLLDAGYKVGEITGRTHTIEYRKNGTFYRVRPGAETTIAGRRKTISGFNRGDLDVMILNQAGATGLSLHASRTFRDQRKRHMIIAQAEGNIDTHMQMLGRVHRTGQVVKPSYEQLVADVPAVKRPAAVLAKKMASLNANTTASRGGALTAKDVPDFMNVYGDTAAVRVMSDNPDVHDDLGSPLPMDEEGEIKKDDAMRKVTGRIPLLPLEQQEQLYEMLEAEYGAILEQADAIGENALEAKTLDLDARPTDTVEVRPAAGSGPFQAAVTAEISDVKRVGRPFPTAEVLRQVAESVGQPVPQGDPVTALAALLKAGRQIGTRQASDAVAEFEIYKTGVTEAMATPDSAKKQETRLEGIRERFMAVMAVLDVGESVRLETSTGNYYGVVTAIERKGKTRNPLALGAWRATIAMADPSRQMTIPFSQLYSEGNKPTEDIESAIIVSARKGIGDMPVIQAFDDMQGQRREKRVVMTGNLLAGFEFTRGQGQIIQFTTGHGQVRQGILMRRGYDIAKELAIAPVPFETAEQVIGFLEKAPTDARVLTSDGALTLSLMTSGNIRFAAKPSKAEGGRYFLSKAAIDAAGRDYVRSGGEMRLEVNPIRANKMIEAYRNADVVFQTVSHKDVAERVKGGRRGKAQAPAVPFEPQPPHPQQGARPAQRSGLVGEASPEFNKAREDLRITLRELLRERAPGLNLEVFDRLTTPEGPVQAYYAAERRIGNALEAMVWVALNAADPKAAAMHEVVHFLREVGAIKPEEWAALERRAADWRRKFDIDARYRNFALSEDQLNEEAIAEAYGAWATGKMTAAELNASPGIRQFFAWLKNLVAALGRALGMRGFERASDVFGAIDRGEVGARTTVIEPTRMGERPLVVAVDPRAADRAFLAELAAERNIQLTQEQLDKARGPMFQTFPRVRGSFEQEAVMERIGVRDGVPEGMRIRERLAEMRHGWWDRVRQGLFDQYHAIAQLEKGIFGALRDAAVSAYKLARMTPNISGMMHVVLNRGPLRWNNGSVEVADGFEGGFNGIFKGLAERGLLPLWKAWAIANRASRLIGEERENLLQQSDIDALLPLAEQYPEFRDVLEKWQRFNGAMLDFAQEAGLIDPEQRRLWESHDYVPFYRVLEEGVGGPKRGKRGLTGQSSGVRTLFGGDQAINDLIENMVMNMTRLVDSAMKNEAGRRTAEMAEAAGAFERVERDWRVAHVSATQAAAKLREIGVAVGNVTVDQDGTTRLTGAAREAWLKLFTMAPPTDKDVIAVRIDGKPVYYRVDDPLLLRAMGAMEWTGYQSLLLQMGAGAKNLLTKGVTMFPDFMIANFLRDGLASWVVTGGETNPLKAAAALLRGYSKNDPSVIAIQAAGADVTGWYDTRPEDVRRQYEEGTGQRPSGLARQAWNAWQRVGQASERANRIAVYDARIAAGDSPQEAAYQAMDLLDFRMRGDWAATRLLTEVVPFLNARLQGLYRLGRYAAANPRAFFLRGAALALAAVGALLAVRDDERWRRETDHNKNNYLYLPTGTGTLFKLPIPFEVGALFMTMPMRLTQAVIGPEAGGDTWKKFGQQVGQVILHQLNMDPTPQLVKPIIEQMTNRNAFGVPIVSRDLERLRPEEQFTDRTSGLAHLLSAAAPEALPDPLRSPVRIDHAVRAYLGTLGTAILGASTGVHNVLRGKEGATARMEEWPVVGRFLADQTKDPLGSHFVQDFYELTKDVEHYAASVKRLRQLGMTEQAGALYAERRNEIALQPYMDRVQNQMAGINRQLRIVRNRLDLGAEERRAEIDRLNGLKINLAERAVTTARARGVE